MRRRVDRQQDFEAIKQNLFAAGVSTVKAAKAQEAMFSTTLEALAEAYESTGANQLKAGEEKTGADLTPIVEALLAQRQQALENHDYDAYVEAEEKLQRLDELVVTRLERQVRLLKAQKQLVEGAAQAKPSGDGEEWTEAKLKKEYKTVADIREAFGISARTWKDAVKQVNETAPSA
jgi:hypothetical protein